MNLAIRDVALRDFPQVRELYRSLDFYPEEELPFDQLEKQFMRHKQYPDYRILVA